MLFKDDFIPKPKRSRVIAQLRRRYPGRWTWNSGAREWQHESGWAVRAYAALAPRYDGDDDTFRTEYRRTDNHELVWVF